MVERYGEADIQKSLAIRAQIGPRRRGADTSA